MMAILYFVMGVLFTYMAFTYADETVFNWVTILLLLVATLDFVVAYRYIKFGKNRRK